MFYCLKFKGGVSLSQKLDVILLFAVVLFFKLKSEELTTMNVVFSDCRYDLRELCHTQLVKRVPTNILFPQNIFVPEKKIVSKKYFGHNFVCLSQFLLVGA